MPHGSTASPESERTKEAVALDLANLFVSEFNRQEDPLATLKLAPAPTPGRLAQPGHPALGH